MSNKQKTPTVIDPTKAAAYAALIKALHQEEANNHGPWKNNNLKLELAKAMEE